MKFKKDWNYIYLGKVVPCNCVSVLIAHVDNWLTLIILNKVECNTIIACGNTESCHPFVR